MINGLHHNAYRCRDSEETRQFYEGFLGLPFAFFEAPDRPFDFKQQHDFDLHIALEVTMDVLYDMFERGKAVDIETRGLADHGFIHSIYFRDPNGYVVESAAKIGAGSGDITPARA